MRVVSIKLPAPLAEEVRKMSHLESLKRGRLVTFSGLMRELAEDYVRRERQRGLEAATAGGR